MGNSKDFGESRKNFSCAQTRPEAVTGVVEEKSPHPEMRACSQGLVNRVLGGAAQSSRPGMLSS
ncbi:MAG: hypothetical protein H6965_00950 [Chromatiaceae bacterium]|nr:hypothetical protein [Chromatiaceae bacterium]